MPRLTRQLNREDPKTGDKWYRWRIDLDRETVEALGWEHGEDLEAEVRGGTLTLRPRKPARKPHP